MWHTFSLQHQSTHSLTHSRDTKAMRIENIAMAIIKCQAIMLKWELISAWLVLDLVDISYLFHHTVNSKKQSILIHTYFTRFISLFFFFYFYASFLHRDESPCYWLNMSACVPIFLAWWWSWLRECFTTCIDALHFAFYMQCVKYYWTYIFMWERI